MNRNVWTRNALFFLKEKHYFIIAFRSSREWAFIWKATANYILIPETSYLEDACISRNFNSEEKPFHGVKRIPGWLNDHFYSSEVRGRFSVIAKNGTDYEPVAVIEAERDFMITHNFGAFEQDANTIIFDAITWDSAAAYDKHTFIKEAFYGPLPKNNITRFTIHLDSETVDMELLHDQDEDTWIEFSQINWKYAEENQNYR